MGNITGSIMGNIYTAQNKPFNIEKNELEQKHIDNIIEKLIPYINNKIRQCKTNNQNILIVCTQYSIFGDSSEIIDQNIFDDIIKIIKNEYIKNGFDFEYHVDIQNKTLLIKENKPQNITN